jgi:Fic family protein
VTAKNKRYSESVSVFQGRALREPGSLVGYAALISYHGLQVPLPARLALISTKHKTYETGEWLVLTPRHAPDDNLAGHLSFALKYEGVDLAVLHALFEAVDQKTWVSLVKSEPTGAYSRRIWFCYEWLTGKKLKIADVRTGNYIDLLDVSLQYGASPQPSKRHRIRNNLPGVRNFCPLVRRTEKTEAFMKLDLPGKTRKTLGRIHPDLVSRTAAFLLLKDSKASYAIEGERPPQNRAQRWGKAIGQAGQQPLSAEELIRLQQLVIENARFVHMGWRKQGGFVGTHDRRDGSPIPEHISARWQDIQTLIGGLVETTHLLEKDDTFDAVMAASLISFGFVFIHPFEDGNGRVHRYLVHHVLARKKYVPEGFIFPVSAVILGRLTEYRKTLENFSLPRLDLIEWKTTAGNNVQVLNETIDLYRYFDATAQVEFLYDCVRETAETAVPAEVDYLEKYDRFKRFLDEEFEMPDKTIALLVRFLEQNKARLSERAQTNEFKALKANEVKGIEKKYAEIFGERGALF